MPERQAAAVIIHYNTDAYTRALLAMLQQHCSTALAYIVVVDNGSDVPFTTADDRVTIVRHETNRGYAAACNAGAAAHEAAYYFFLNSDIEFSTDVLSPLLDFMERDDTTGVIAPALQFPDGRFQLSWGEEPSLMNEFKERRRQQEMHAGGGPAYDARKRESMQRREADWATGAALLIRKEAFDAVRGFDEGYFFYFEDADLCCRIRRAGWRIVYEPAVTITHYGGGSQEGFNPAIASAYRSGQLRFYARFRGRISFYLLKIYLSSVFGFRMLTDSYRREDYSRLLRLIRKFPYSSVTDRA